MSFDISKLTSAVNKYLNSISEISIAAKRAQEEIDSKTKFSTELSNAIQQNIENRMHDQVTMPDIGKQVQDTVETQVKQAVSSIDNTFEQVNGAFEEIRNAGVANKTDNTANTVTDTVKTPEAAKAVDSTKENSDAYNGTLSTKALQDLSKSQYFSANLIHSSLFKEGNDSEDKNSGTSAFDTVSLSDLNTNSLLANALTSGNVASATNSAESSDLAKALIKAYTNNASAASTTSIFGDFAL